MTYTALFGLSVLVLLAIIYWTTAQAITRQTDDTITAEIDALYQHYDTEGLTGLVHTIEDRDSTQGVTGGLYLLTDPSLRRIAGNVSAWPVGAKEMGDWLVFGLTGHSGEAAFGRGRAFLLPGGFRLLVGRDMRALERFQSLMVEAMAWACAATLALGIGGGFAFSRRVVARLEAINGTAERIMGGDITHRVEVSGRDDEFDRLAVTLNDMLDQIEHLMAGVRTVTNNIAHDLRSPLTRMRSELEGAMVAADSAEELRETCGQVITEADSLLATFNALLSIAEAEAGTRLAEAVPVDLVALVEDVVDLYGPLAEDAGKTLLCDQSQQGPVTVTGNRELLFQALSNLIDNAIKYTPSPGTISVRVARPADGLPELMVMDDGLGVPVKDRDRILGRFVRLDASRTTPGNGLGLSLVAAICQLHRATLSLGDGLPRPARTTLSPLKDDEGSDAQGSAASHPDPQDDNGHGLCVRITFPLTLPSAPLV